MSEEHQYNRSFVDEKFHSAVANNRPPVEHMNMEPWIYKYTFYIWVSIIFGSLLWAPVCFALLSFICYKVGYGFPWYVVIVGMFVACLDSRSRLRTTFTSILTSRWQGHEFLQSNKAPLKACYKDSALIWKLWLQSPYRLSMALQSGNNPGRDQMDSEDEPYKMTVFQVSEGYCGPATLNTFLASLPNVPLMAFQRMPAPLSMKQVQNALSFETNMLPEAASTFIKKVDSIPVNLDVSLGEFTAILKQANEPNKRVLCNFLRSSLCNSQPGMGGSAHRVLENMRQTSVTKNNYSTKALHPEDDQLVLAAKAAAQMAGHWSPIGACDDEHVLIMDVNPSYGPFIATISDLYEACKTKDGAHWRGLVVVHM